MEDLIWRSEFKIILMQNYKLLVCFLKFKFFIFLVPIAVIPNEWRYLSETNLPLVSENLGPIVKIPKK